MDRYEQEAADKWALRMGKILEAADGMPTEEAVAAIKIYRTLQAVADTNMLNKAISEMSTEEAVKYIEHGREMLGLLMMASVFVPQCQIANEIENMRNKMKLEAK